MCNAYTYISLYTCNLVVCKYVYIYIYYFAQIYYQYLGSQDESNFDKHFDELGSPGILENSTY